MVKIAAAAPDGIVKGYFKSEEYTARLSTSVSCINNKPAGFLSMQANGAEIWRIVSNRAIDVDTEKSPLSDHVHVVYGDVIVKNETTGQKFINCTAFLDASEWPIGRGLIGINVTLVVYHKSRTRPVFEWDGIFYGEMNVNREVSCEE